VVGAEVKKGERIGEGKGFVSSPIHASVSGKVLAIETREHPGGSFVPCVVIENNGREEWAETVRPAGDPAALTPEELRRIIFGAGIVGLGGATFPAHVKYASVEGKKIETVILIGVECEPYITADHRLMLERAERIVAGLGYIMRSVGCKKCLIAIEDNKMDAVSVMEKAAAAGKNISVVVLRGKYPQGSENSLSMHAPVRRCLSAHFLWMWVW
jgi:Na+-translocating ferredoxin:NAD+ oxidoreductase subunit C